MTRDETLDRLRDLQHRAHELREATESPTLERTMQLFDMYCHIARWELGDVDGFTENIGGARRPPEFPPALAHAPGDPGRGSNPALAHAPGDPGRGSRPDCFTGSDVASR